MIEEKATLKLLIKKNKAFVHEYKTKNHLIQLMTSHHMTKKTHRKQLLDYLQVFSDAFQKVVLLRYSLCENSKFLKISWEHLSEEFGHNMSLLRDRRNKASPWDAALAAASSWFAWKMLTLNNEEKTVLIHLVLETSAHIFFQEAHKVMSKYNDTDYFKIHSEADEKHEKMGTTLLKNLSSEAYKQLFVIQQQGWDMLNLACNQIASLIPITPT